MLLRVRSARKVGGLRLLCDGGRGNAFEQDLSCPVEMPRPCAVARTVRSPLPGYGPFSESTCPRSQSASAVGTRRALQQRHLIEGQDNRVT